MIELLGLVFILVLICVVGIAVLKLGLPEGGLEALLGFAIIVIALGFTVVCYVAVVRIRLLE